ncbi:ComEC/Rec2 family competence protein [Chitinophaga filiformis]|uniref:Competence protein ComEC n=1 Tax=Chitinophaga filiformis TaxID=104663 RepID=A0A1G7UTV9_CHIFI|nr:ComEC/Rec2 family competence protein [Chitinophaga filiformis]SDG50549.1 competence protein ComEC [Chitinophaga filiformis]
MFVAFLKRAPFLRLILSLSAGISVQLYMPFNPLIVFTAAGLLGVTLFVFQKLPFRFRFQYDWLRGIVLQLLIVCSGSLLVYQSDIRRSSSYFDTLLRPTDLLIATVGEPIQQKARSYKTVVNVRHIIRDNRSIRASGRLLVYLSKDSAAGTLQEGDRLLIPSQTTPVQHSGNPGAFDYRRYCSNQQIYRQAFLRSGGWRRLPGKEENPILQVIFQCRQYCLHTLQQYIGGREAGLAAALLIGYRYDLDREMVQDYTNTGIVHIIAISGMHLALIYGGLLWILCWWPKHRFSEGLKGCLIILLLWAFTLLTGGAASVLRATVMFTFITVGKFMLDRYTNIYNTLAASAFLLLCYEPRLLMDVGFQLSYLAVLSIVICYRHTYYLFQSSRRWLDKLWDMTALTLAAQVLTLPVCLYYFHQFPVFFLPANMLTVPLSTIVLYGEILLLIVGGVPVLANGTGYALQILMQWMNRVVSRIGHLPGALITDINMHPLGMICLYSCIAGLLIWWLHQWRQGLLVALTGLALWSISLMLSHINEQYQHKMVVYNIPGHTCVEVIQKHQVATAGDRDVMRSDSLYNRYLRPAHVLYGIKQQLNIDSGISGPAFAGLQILSLGQKRLVIVDSALPRIMPQKKFRTDYLLLSHNPQVDIRQLEQMFDVGCYIFDASSRLRNIQQWKSDCYMLTLRFFSVPDQGAYVVNF